MRIVPENIRTYAIRSPEGLRSILNTLPDTGPSTSPSAAGNSSEPGSRTYRDGLRILSAGIRLFKEMRPLRFFSLLAVVLTCTAVGLGIPLLVEYAETGLVPRVPTAILAAAIQIVALIFLICGIVLDSVCQLRRDAKRLTYLGIPQDPG